MSRVTRSKAGPQGGNTVLSDSALPTTTTEVAATSAAPAKGRGRGVKTLTPAKAVTQGSAPIDAGNDPQGTAEHPQHTPAPKNNRRNKGNKNTKKTTEFTPQALSAAQEAFITVFLNIFCALPFLIHFQESTTQVNVAGPISDGM
jgi:hypothetical protein